jgi:hypothetical protein
MNLATPLPFRLAGTFDAMAAPAITLAALARRWKARTGGAPRVVRLLDGAAPCERRRLAHQLGAREARWRLLC